MELINAVRKYRRHKGLTQEQLAEKAGVTRQTIISTEKGYYIPSIKFALTLALILETPLEKLFWLSPNQGEGNENHA